MVRASKIRQEAMRDTNLHYDLEFTGGTELRLNRSAGMARDWDSEWEVLLGRERAAFRVRNGAFGELMPHLARCAPVDMDLLSITFSRDALNLLSGLWTDNRALCSGLS
jgi:hypothetical protein